MEQGQIGKHIVFHVFLETLKLKPQLVANSFLTFLRYGIEQQNLFPIFSSLSVMTNTNAFFIEMSSRQVLKTNVERLFDVREFLNKACSTA